MPSRLIYVVACSLVICCACKKSRDSSALDPVPETGESSVSQAWIIGAWTAENGSFLEFKTDGSFEQVYTDTVLAPGQVIYDEESAKNAQFTKTKVTTVGTYRWLDHETMEIERQGTPSYQIKIKRDANDLLLIGDGGRQDRLHRNNAE